MPRAAAPSRLFPNLGFGLGLRARHYSDVLDAPPRTSQWFEVVSENFMQDGGRSHHILERLRSRYPVVLHGVSLNIGSADPLDQAYLERLRQLVARCEPALVSDHLCWTGVNGRNLHDLFPLPYTRETARYVAARIGAVQDTLKRRILIENVSSYLTYGQSEMTEWEFLTEVSERADCGLLLDVNNIYVSAVNHAFDPLEFLSGVPAARVGQIHLAGHSTDVAADGSRFLVDTHDHPVCAEVWDLYAEAVAIFGGVSTMIERDAEIPEYAELEAELETARSIAATARGGVAEASCGVAATHDNDDLPSRPRESSPQLHA